MKIASDNSYYNIFSPAQYDILASGTDGAIIRIGFGLTLDKSRIYHLEQFRDRGTAVAGYYWCDPNWDRTRQIALIVETTKQLRLPSVFLDAETYWSDWAAYMKQDLATCYATRYLPDYLNEFYHDIYEGVKKGLEPEGIEVGNYSANWFIDRYAPDMKSWIYNKNYWYAGYLRYTNPKEKIALINKLGEPFDISRLPKFEAIAPITHGIGRQWESLLPVKGLNVHQDWNFFTEEGFNRMFGTSYPTPPPPPPAPPPPPSNTYIINTNSLRIRKGPGTNYPIIGGYWTGEKVMVLEVSGDWGRTDKGWINLNYTLPIQSSYMVTAVFLTIREYPFIHSKAVGWLKYGDHVFEVGHTGIWINIGRGWVKSSYLKVV